MSDKKLTRKQRKENRKYDRTIAFVPVFVRLTGSVQGALFLSQAMYWNYQTDDTDGWFYKTRDDWERETFLTHDEQRSARSVLRSVCGSDGTPILEEKFVGIPPKMYFRINDDVVDELVDSGFVGPRKYKGNTKNLIRPDVGTDGDKCPDVGTDNRPDVGTDIYNKITVETTNISSDEDTSCLQANTEGVPSLLFEQEALLPQETKKQPKKKEDVPQTSEQQQWFGAICKTVGWDYKTLTKEQQGQVAQTVSVLVKAEYTIDDLRRFYKEWFSNDWRGQKGQYPTITQLRAEIGKLKADLPPTSVDSPFNRIAILT